MVNLQNQDENDIITDKMSIEKQIKDLYGHLENTEIDGYNSPQDRNIAKMVISKYFAKYPNNIKKEIKEDCILELWAKRSQFRDDMGASYETWGFAVCRNAMLNKYAGKVIMDYNCDSFSKVLGIDDNGKEFTLGDTITDGKQIDLAKVDKLTKQEKVIAENFDNTNKQKIIELTLQGYPTREIVRMVGVNRQYVTRIRAKYKKALQSAS